MLKRQRIVTVHEVNRPTLKEVIFSLRWKWTKETIFNILEEIFYWTAHLFMWHFTPLSCRCCAPLNGVLGRVLWSGAASWRFMRSVYIELFGTDRCRKSFRRIGGDCVLSVHWLFQINENTAGMPHLSTLLHNQIKCFFLNLSSQWTNELAQTFFFHFHLSAVTGWTQLIKDLYVGHGLMAF